MDGESLQYKLRQVLQEGSTSTFLDTRTSYDYLFEAAKDFQRRTNALTDTETITSVANQRTYDLPSDFMHLYFRNQWNELVLAWWISAATTASAWLKHRDYDIFTQNLSTSTVSIPDHFTIIDKHSQTSRITGTVTSAGALAYEECTLTDSSAPFSNVSPGDNVHNTTDGSNGIVVEVTSTSALLTVLFGGTDNDWDAGDSYIVVPQGRKSIIVDPIPSDSTSSFYVDYAQLPVPVYSSYRSYRFDAQFEMPLVYYAAWLYKYRDQQPNFGDTWYKQWDVACRKATSEIGKSYTKKSFRVNFMKRSYRDRSYR